MEGNFIRREWLSRHALRRQHQKTNGREQCTEVGAHATEAGVVLETDDGPPEEIRPHDCGEGYALPRSAFRNSSAPTAPLALGMSTWPAPGVSWKDSASTHPWRSLRIQAPPE